MSARDPLALLDLDALLDLRSALTEAIDRHGKMPEDEEMAERVDRWQALAERVDAYSDMESAEPIGACCPRCGRPSPGTGRFTCGICRGEEYPPSEPQPTQSYAARELQRQLDRGPYPGEDFFRLKVTGDGGTPHVNVTPDQLAAIVAVLS
jgi:hypothetical protein